MLLGQVDRYAQNRAMCLTLNVIGSCLSHNQLQHCAIFVISFLFDYNRTIISLFNTTAYFLLWLNSNMNNLETKSTSFLLNFLLEIIPVFGFSGFLAQLVTLAHCSGVCVIGSVHMAFAACGSRWMFVCWCH